MCSIESSDERLSLKSQIFDWFGDFFFSFVNKKISNDFKHIIKNQYCGNPLLKGVWAEGLLVKVYS